MKNFLAYADFKKALLDSNCTKCALSDSRTNIVVDRGNSSAKVLNIGEAPGQNEDLQGKAFVGRAGQLLDRLMKDVGFDTNQDSLIVNLVKCRPPKNRAPLPEEVASEIDREVNVFIEKAFNAAKKIISSRKNVLEKIAKVLMEKETLEQDEFYKIIESFKLKPMVVR